jgi:hypothetical protein
MPWTYSQTTGDLTLNKPLAGKNYSGTGAGRDYPARRGVHNVGPIP